MEWKILDPEDKLLLWEFLLNLSPETLNMWHHYGSTFSAERMDIIMKTLDIKIAGIQQEKTGTKKRKIIVFGHLYKFKNTHCRLGIVSVLSGKCYGQLMMKMLIDEGRKRGMTKICLSVFLDNQRAIDLYLSNDFKIIKTYSDRPRKAYEMELELK
jgi:GNAT superfamily N-acetyltransferase